MTFFVGFRVLGVNGRKEMNMKGRYDKDKKLRDI
jgi:hypothetical protein